MATKAINTTNPSRKPGELSSLRSEVAGPVKVYLDSNRRDDAGELIMEEYETIDDKVQYRQERDSEPFLTEVYYKKNYMTPNMEEKLAAIKNDPKYDDKPLLSAAFSIEMLVASWDLKNNGKPVKPNQEDIIANDVPADVLFSTLAACYEHNRPPKGLSGRLQNTSSQEE